METVTIPRVLYDVLWEGLKRNANALEVIMNAQRAGKRWSIAEVYAALTGLDEATARQELLEWKAAGTVFVAERSAASGG